MNALLLSSLGWGLTRENSLGPKTRHSISKLCLTKWFFTTKMKNWNLWQEAKLAGWSVCPKYAFSVLFSLFFHYFHFENKSKLKFFFQPSYTYVLGIGKLLSHPQESWKMQKNEGKNPINDRNGCFWVTWPTNPFGFLPGLSKPCSHVSNPFFSGSLWNLSPGFIAICFNFSESTSYWI